MPIDIKDLVKSTELTYTAAAKDSGRSASVQINTSRLIIKSITLDDVEFMQSLWANQKIMQTFGDGTCRFYCGNDEDKKLKACKENSYDYAKWRIVEMDNSWLKRLAMGNIWSGYIVCLSVTGTKIGHLILGGGELAYFFHPDFWHKGYATEAVVAFVKIAVPKLIQDYKVPSPGNQIHPNCILASIGAEVVKGNRASWKILQYAGFSLVSQENITHLGDAPVGQYQRKMWQATVPIELLIKDYNSLVCSIASPSAGAQPSQDHSVALEIGSVKKPLLNLRFGERGTDTRISTDKCAALKEAHSSNANLVKDDQNVPKSELVPRTKFSFMAKLLGGLYYIFVAPIIFLLSPLLMLFMTFNIKLSLNLGGMLAFAGTGIKHYFTIRKAYKLLKKEHREKNHVNSLIKAQDTAVHVANEINQSDFEAKGIAPQQGSAVKEVKAVMSDGSEDSKKDGERKDTATCQETLITSNDFKVMNTTPENAGNHTICAKGGQEPKRIALKS